MKVFLSYHRASSRWPARLIKDRLENKGANVFMDVDSINSGRFENVILNEIGRRDHFLLLLTPEGCRRLGNSEDWVRKEVERAIELRKNVVPVLLDGAVIENVSMDFPKRRQLLEINALTLTFELFSEAMNTLYDRYLSRPTIEELEIKTAEEYFKAGEAAIHEDDWENAEIQFEKATRLRRRPEYLLGLAVAKHRQKRSLEALNDLDAAITIDPFAGELMSVKFDLLQEMDRMDEAIKLPDRWRVQAQKRATNLTERIFDQIAQGNNLVEAVQSISELASLYGQNSEIEMIGTSVSVLLEHLEGDLRMELRQLWETWLEQHE